MNYYPWTGTTIAQTTTPTGLSGIPRYGSANLTWSSNTEPFLSGYKIYYGTASKSYGPPVMVGRITSQKVTGLVNSTPYYIAISSLNSIGAESALSQEITVTPVNKYAVDLTIAGTGNGNVLFPQAGTACNTNCTVLFDPYTAITLQDSAEQYTLFKGWFGAYSAPSGDCNLIMDGDKAITATFDKDIDHLVRVDLPTMQYYPSLSAAYLGASSAAIIKAWGTDFTENLTLDRGISVIIKGGFNPEYSSNAGATVLHGTVNVRKGKLTVEKVELR